MNLYDEENVKWLTDRGFSREKGTYVPYYVIVGDFGKIQVWGELFSPECYIEVRGHRYGNRFDNFSELCSELVSDWGILE